MSIWRSIRTAGLAVAISLPALFLTSSHSTSQPQQPCGPEGAVLDYLSRHYQEFPVFHGDDGLGNKLILTRTDGDGIWTLLAVSEGIACIRAAGPRSRFDKGI